MSRDGKCHCEHVDTLITEVRQLKDQMKGVAMHLQQTVVPKVEKVTEDVKKHEEALRGIIGDAWIPSMVATAVGSVGMNGSPGQYSTSYSTSTNILANYNLPCWLLIFYFLGM